MKIYFWSIVLFLLIFCQQIKASTYYVTTEVQLNTAIAVSVEGDTIVMADGVWLNIHIPFSGEGTRENPITLQAETRGEVYLEGNSKLSLSGNYLIVDGLHFRNGYVDSSDKAVIEFRTSSSDFANNCRVTNCSIINYNPMSSSIEYKYVSIYGTYNRFDHCHLEGKTNNGATLVIWRDATENHHLIDYNYFGPRPDLGQNGGETIRCGDSGSSLSDSYSSIENNLFFQCNGEIEIISNKSGKNIFRYNTFRDCTGLLTLRHGNGSEVYNNFFFGNYLTSGQGGIRVVGENHKIYNNYFQDLNNGSSNIRGAIVLMNGELNPALNGYAPVVNVLIANNTFVSNKISLIVGGGVNSTRVVPPDQSIIVNNIFYSTRDNVLIEHQSTPTNHNYSANIAFGDLLGINSETGINEIDPLLQVPDFDELWRPSVNSPVINNGESTYIDGIFMTDFDGQTRESNNFDIGGDEVIEDAINIKPHSILDVGPIAPNILLPVGLVRFKGEEIGMCNKLMWETSIEFELSYFEIQRKTSVEEDFQTIGIVEPIGASMVNRFYSFSDKTPDIKSYYRLKLIDLDGLVSYSNIVTITRSIQNSSAFIVFPNPFIKDINIIIDWDELKNHSDNIFIVIYDLSGKEIIKRVINSECQNKNYQFKNLVISSGGYIIKIFDNNNSYYSEKIICIDD